MTNITLIIIICSITLIGFIAFLLDIRKFKRNAAKVHVFYASAQNLLASLGREDTNAFEREFNYLLRESDDAAELYDYPNSPLDYVSLFVSDLRNQNKPALEQDVLQLYSQAEIASSQWEKKASLVLEKNIWNPFSWFAKGVITLIDLVFGYLLRLVNIDVESHPKIWNGLCSIIGALAGIVALIEFYINVIK